VEFPNKQNTEILAANRERFLSNRDPLASHGVHPNARAPELNPPNEGLLYP
jgi:hypothetical protein